MLFSDQSERLPITFKGLSASDFLGDLFTNHIPVVAFSLAVIAALLACSPGASCGDAVPTRRSGCSCSP